MAAFPSSEWLSDFMEKLNTDEQYAKIAKNWEGDLLFVIDPDENVTTSAYLYLDLWHGKCRHVEIRNDIGKVPAFILRSGYSNFLEILSGNLDPMQAMMTRKLNVKGNMLVMMRNVPTVLDFVRCAREISQ
ncbi:MAG TPA: SCP2 sterol-binding domain-containing protein [Anaerolineales bacterium]|nr:SCP2 sterol-binding domain-containing protein [Anaerolineales bacterium]